MRVKICGLTQTQQAIEIVNLGADSIGFICVPSSPRYLSPRKIGRISAALPDRIQKVGVFARYSVSEIIETVATAGLNSVQLHGDESAEFCDRLHQELPDDIELIKAFRIETAASLADTTAYLDLVDTLLLDAYHPHQLGGTGKTIDWRDLEQFRPPLPWMLAGGLNPNNINDALSRLHPDGIDLSSGVERSPGDKDLTLVKKLFQQLNINSQHS